MTMGLVSDTIQAVNTILSNAAANAASAIYNVPVYYDHITENLDGNTMIQYPIIITKVISSPRQYSMSNSSSKANTYTVIRMQVAVYHNEDNFTALRTIQDGVESILSFGDLPLQEHNFMACYTDGEGITFWDKEQKIYTSLHDYRIFVGD